MQARFNVRILALVAAFQAWNAPVRAAAPSIETFCEAYYAKKLTGGDAQFAEVVLKEAADLKRSTPANCAEVQSILLAAKELNFNYPTGTEEAPISAPKRADLSLLAHFTQAETLFVSNWANQSSEDYAPIASLKQLKLLGIENGGLKVIDFIQTLTALTELSLAGNSGIQDLSPLSNLVHLKSLHLDGLPSERFALLTALENLPLEFLNLQGGEDDFGESTHLESIAKMPALKTLVLTARVLRSLAPLGKAPALESLDISYSTFAGKNPLAGLETAPLTQLLVRYSNMTDQTIGEAGPFPHVTTLDLAQNRFTQMGMLSAFPALQFLEFSQQLTSTALDLSALAPHTQLKAVALNANRIEDIAPLSALVQLEVLELAHNEITDVSPLVPLSHLKSLELRNQNKKGTPVLRDLSPLKNLASTALPPVEENGVTVWDVASLLDGNAIVKDEAHCPVNTDQPFLKNTCETLRGL